MVDYALWAILYKSSTVWTGYALRLWIVANTPKQRGLARGVEANSLMAVAPRPNKPQKWFFKTTFVIK